MPEEEPEIPSLPKPEIRAADIAKEFRKLVKINEGGQCYIYKAERVIDN
jgi:hypothetical protein